MSGSRINPVALFIMSLFVFSLFAIHIPQTADAEPMYLLKSDNIKKAAENTIKVSTLGFDDKGNLTIRNGNLSVVLIYNPSGSENEAISNKTPVVMAMNREPPEMTGIGVKLSLTF